MARKKIKKRVWIKINGLNVALFLFCIAVGFLIVSLGGSVKTQQYTRQQDPQLLQSAHRIAEAFDQYNEKRFEK